jgi:GDPmannose 4,6-dehydratase
LFYCFFVKVRNKFEVQAMKKALITGVTGQDGSYLSEFLLNKDYQVYGMVRRTSYFSRGRIEHLNENKNFNLVYGDLCDSSSVTNLVREIMPNEIYNLAAQSHVRISFDIPEYTGDADGVAVTRFLEVIRKIKDETGKEIKFYQASTSELYGLVQETPQKETTPFYPRSPYGVAKLYAYWIVKNYRESYGLFACNGILFNHESPRRGENFVTRKITKDVAAIKEGQKEFMTLGNLDAMRDWGHARDFVEAQWMILQHKDPDDFVIATGETHSVREFLEEAFSHAGMNVKSNGKKGIEEQYINLENNKPVVKIDQKYFRPAEVDFLLGDPSKAKKMLGWKPRTLFKDLVKEMFEADLKIIQQEIYGKKGKR